MFKCFDSTALDGNVFLYFEFGATELNSMFKTNPLPLPCNFRIKFIPVCHHSSTTFETGLICNFSEDFMIKWNIVIRFATTFKGNLHFNKKITLNHRK